jgi:hypothetical protein
MPATYEPLATTTLGTSAASITFSGISASYTDLRLVVSALASASTIGAYIIYNNDTGANYTWGRLSGNGSSASALHGGTATQVNIANQIDSTTTIPAVYEVDIFQYSTSRLKMCLVTGSGDKNGSGVVERMVGLWRSTSTINRIDIFPNSANNFATGSTATLYGILRA